MAMNVNRAGLLSVLESVQAGTSAKEIVEQSSCFVFQGGSVHTYNDEVACRGDSGIDPSLTGAVQAQSLLAVLRKMPEEELTLEVGDGELLLSGVRRRAGIRMEKEISLPLNVVEKPDDGAWKKLHEDFSEALQTVQQCASKDQDQFSLTCVHLHPQWIEACDNHQLCRWSLETGIQQAALVRRESIKHVTALGVTEFAETNSWLHFRNPRGLVFSCRRFLEEFPDLGQILEVQGDRVMLPKGIVEATEMAEIFSSENSEANHVEVVLRSNRVCVRGAGLSGWYQETRKVQYKGTPIHFLIAPDLLRDMVKKYSECIISEDRLKVDSRVYQYVTCLYRPSDKEENPEGREE